MRRMWLVLVALAIAGCDDGCPGIGSGRSGFVTATALELSGDCTTPTPTEIDHGLITLPAGCETGDAHGATADQCESTILAACPASYGAFRWSGLVVFTGDGIHEGIVDFARFDDDAALICEGTYRVRYVTHR